MTTYIKIINSTKGTAMTMKCCPVSYSICTTDMLCKVCSLLICIKFA